MATFSVNGGNLTDARVPAARTSIDEKVNRELGVDYLLLFSTSISRKRESLRKGELTVGALGGVLAIQ